MNKNKIIVFHTKVRLREWNKTRKERGHKKTFNFACIKPYKASLDYYTAAPHLIILDRDPTESDIAYCGTFCINEVKSTLFIAINRVGKKTNWRQVDATTHSIL